MTSPTMAFSVERQLQQVPPAALACRFAFGFLLRQQRRGTFQPVRFQVLYTLRGESGFLVR